MADAGRERRQHERYDAELSVDWSSGENFLFSYIANISEMGIFIRSDDPPSIGTCVRMRFNTGEETLELDGEVVWINPVRDDGENLNPGMGVRFTQLTPDQRERVVEIVRTVAYLGDEPP
jgi:type IV pilus assembly protein PilZ